MIATISRDNSSHLKQGVYALAVLLTMMVIADGGFLSEGDAAIYAVVVSLLWPSLSPYLLISTCGFQDAAGLSSTWCYIGVVLVGIVVVLRWLEHGGLKLLFAQSRIRLIAGLAVGVVLYSILSSMANMVFEGRPQASGREPLLVGGLMFFMIIAGIATASEIGRDVDSSGRLILTISVLFVNGLFVSASKILLGPDVFTSVAGRSQILDADQLVDPTPLGFPRITGTYLSPNGFALCYGLLLLLLLWRYGNAPPTRRFVLTYLSIGFLLTVLSLSKAMAIFFALTSIVMVIQNRKLTAPILVIAAIFAGVLATVVDSRLMLDAFRVPSSIGSDSGFRSIAWRAVLQTLRPFDWLFGTGLAFWPNLFLRTLGYGLSDPHTYLLSIPGTYGVFGIMLYAVLAFILIRRYRQTTGATRIIAGSLLILFFVKDLVSIPYLLGNTPITLLIWTLLAMSLTTERLQNP